MRGASLQRDVSEQQAVLLRAVVVFACANVAPGTIEMDV